MRIQDERNSMHPNEAQKQEFQRLDDAVVTRAMQEASSVCKETGRVAVYSVDYGWMPIFWPEQEPSEPTVANAAMVVSYDSEMLDYSGEVLKLDPEIAFGWKLAQLQREIAEERFRMPLERMVDDGLRFELPLSKDVQISHLYGVLVSLSSGLPLTTRMNRQTQACLLLTDTPEEATHALLRLESERSISSLLESRAMYERVLKGDDFDSQKWYTTDADGTLAYLLIDLRRYCLDERDLPDAGLDQLISN